MEEGAMKVLVSVLLMGFAFEAMAEGEGKILTISDVRMEEIESHRVFTPRGERRIFPHGVIYVTELVFSGDGNFIMNLTESEYDALNAKYTEAKRQGEAKVDLRSCAKASLPLELVCDYKDIRWAK